MPFDPFGYDRKIYTIKNTCLEVPELPYDDGAKTMFLYTKGREGTVSQGLQELLRYMEDTTEENAINDDLRDIHNMVVSVKRNAEVSREYMKWAEIQEMWKKDGYTEGCATGQLLEFQNTVRKLLSKGMTKAEVAELLDKDMAEIEKVIIE